MSGTTDLIGLIDLSLGEKPSGVVNFNYLHCLLHEIVRRLGVFEEQQMTIASGPLSGYLQNVDSSRTIIRGSTTTIQEHSDISLPHTTTTGTSGMESTPATPGHSSSIITPGHGASTAHPSAAATTTTPGHSSSVSATSNLPTTTSIPAMAHSSSLPTATPSHLSSSGLPLQHSTTTTDPTSKQQSASSVPGEDKGAIGSERTSSSDIGATGRPLSSADIHRPASRVRHRRSSIVSAANDLGFLERKLQELETRVNTMESLPELLERKGSDVTATPVRDMWNFTNLNNRVGSVENGIDKTSQVVDDLLGEVQSLKQQLSGVQGSVEKRLDGLDAKFADSANEVTKMEDKLKQLEALKLAASSDSPSDAFVGILNEVQQKVDSLETESNSAKDRVKELEDQMGSVVSSTEFVPVRDSFKDFSSRTDSKLTLLEGKLDAISSDDSVVGLSASVEQLSSQVKNLESVMGEKVSASDLASLMPVSDGDEGATLMPKLIELQTKVNQLQDKVNQQPSIPHDLTDKIAAMQNAIDHLSTEVTKLSSAGMGGVDAGRLDELGSLIAQIKERMEETDRAVGALTDAVSEQGASVAQDGRDEEYVPVESFKDLQQQVQVLQEGQERLLGTAANLSHELEVNQEHVKALYSAADDLRAIKVDKDQLALEVDEKADRSALEGKASREWVDSTFERLDREIREAKSHLLGQEEAFRSAVGQLNEDVEGKLDRMELEPLRAYIDKNLKRIKTAPMNVERPSDSLTDDAAGFRKPLRFKCISCDKPLGLKSTDPVPALPMTDTLPPTRSFRPYTTYELELIRRHQKIQPGVVGPPIFSMSIRSAGGSHTLTRPHQKIRVTPYSGVVPDNTARSTPSVFVHDEMDIVGQDGHIYKGRVVKKGLPPLSKRKNRATRVVRPSSTNPLQSVQS